jgi:DNA-binding transcriptional MerR regulator
MDEERMSIGRFARLTGLTVKALRHYDAEGLLRPDEVDVGTGYRRYASGQIEVGRTIRSLRDLDVPLDAIRAYLQALDTAARADALAPHVRAMEATMWRTQRIVHRLRNLLDDEGGIALTEPTVPATDQDEHRRLGVDLFNETWAFMGKSDRTPEEDLQMLHMAHASAYHWSRAEHGPEHEARGEWQISRVHTVLGQGEGALYHAKACLRICEEHGIGDWDIAFAHEALARAYRILGDPDHAEQHLAAAETLGAEIADPEDRELLEQDLATLRDA